MLYNIVTFGCQMNVHESEKIAGMLENMGYMPTDSKEQADQPVRQTTLVNSINAVTDQVNGKLLTVQSYLDYTNDYTDKANDERTISGVISEANTLLSEIESLLKGGVIL